MQPPCVCYLRVSRPLRRSHVSDANRAKKPIAERACDDRETSNKVGWCQTRYGMLHDQMPAAACGTATPSEPQAAAGARAHARTHARLWPFASRCTLELGRAFAVRAGNSTASDKASDRRVCCEGREKLSVNGGRPPLTD